MQEQELLYDQPPPTTSLTFQSQSQESESGASVKGIYTAMRIRTHLKNALYQITAGCSERMSRSLSSQNSSWFIFLIPHLIQVITMLGPGQDFCSRPRLEDIIGCLEPTLVNLIYMIIRTITELKLTGQTHDWLLL